MDLRDEGEVEIVGLIQEQHPDRCRLFMQWKQMDFPILVDALNRIGVSAVPMLWALDESGVVRGVRPEFEWFAGEFLETDYGESRAATAVEEPDADAIDAYFAGDFDAAIDEWGERAASSRNGAEWFRLGCAYRSRFDSEARREGDFQEAVAAWTRALDRNPRNYIWMRRIQQYGPTLNKPYPFYNWVAAARADIRGRGEEPVTLIAEPEGAELAGPARRLAEAEDLAEPDPEGELEHDVDLVLVESVVAPYPVAPGQSARVSLRFRPSAEAEVHWTNDAGPLSLVVWPPSDWQTSHSVMVSDLRADVPTSSEDRVLDFEVVVPKSAGAGDHEVEGYAVYYVCEGKEGECLYLRQDFSVTVPVGKPASR